MRAEYNRELLVLRYLETRDPKVLGEILGAFDPICAMHAKRTLRLLGAQGIFDLSDLQQEARVRLIELLAAYVPRGSSFERALAKNLFFAFGKIRRKDRRRARAFAALLGVPRV